MIPGSGPGRGTSWWRRVRLQLWSYRWGSPEPVRTRREGRTVAVIEERKSGE